MREKNIFMAVLLGLNILAFSLSEVWGGKFVNEKIRDKFFFVCRYKNCDYAQLDGDKEALAQHACDCHLKNVDYVNNFLKVKCKKKAFDSKIPYFCGICLHETAQAGGVSSHLENVHGKFGYLCKRCGMVESTLWRAQGHKCCENKKPLKQGKRKSLDVWSFFDPEQNDQLLDGAKVWERCSCGKGYFSCCENDEVKAKIVEKMKAHAQCHKQCPVSPERKRALKRKNDFFEREHENKRRHFSQEDLLDSSELENSESRLPSQNVDLHEELELSQQFQFSKTDPVREPLPIFRESLTDDQRSFPEVLQSFYYDIGGYSCLCSDCGKNFYTKNPNLYYHKQVLELFSEHLEKHCAFLTRGDERIFDDVIEEDIYRGLKGKDLYQCCWKRCGEYFYDKKRAINHIKQIHMHLDVDDELDFCYPEVLPDLLAIIKTV